MASKPTTLSRIAPFGVRCSISADARLRSAARRAPTPVSLQVGSGHEPQAQTIVSPTARSAIASASAAPLGIPALTQRRWRIAAITMAAARLAIGYTRPRLTTSVRVTAASPAPVRATKRRVCSARAKRYIESKPKKNATNTATA